MKRFWGILEPGTPLVWGWYLDAICKHLEKVRDKEMQKLLINIAPRHAKTILLALFICWAWIDWPATRFLVCSYSLKRSKEILHKARQVLESPTYRDYFPDVQLRQDRNTQEKFENANSGYAVATSVDSGNTGEGASIILFDDPNDIGEINSEACREKTITFFRSVLSTRLNNPSRDGVVIIQQRAHVSDLTGYLLETQADLWCKLILPYEFDPERRCITKLKKKVFFRDPRKEKGEPLSSRIPPEDIAARKRDSVGLRIWETQYNQLPKPPGGVIFKDEWFRTYEDKGESYKLGNRVFSKSQCWRVCGVDLAISEKQSADYSVFFVADISPEGDMILLDVKRERMNAAKTLAAFEAINSVYRPSYFLIEKVAYQDFLCQFLRLHSYTVRGVAATGDKVARSTSLEIRFSSESVWFPAAKDWLGVVQNEILEFPNGSHDDIVDALTYIALEVGRRVKPIKKAEEAPEKTQEQKYYEALWGEPEPNYVGQDRMTGIIHRFNRQLPPE